MTWNNFPEEYQWHRIWYDLCLFLFFGRCQRQYSLDQSSMPDEWAPLTAGMWYKKVPARAVTAEEGAQSNVLHCCTGCRPCRCHGVLLKQSSHSLAKLRVLLCWLLGSALCSASSLPIDVNSAVPAASPCIPLGGWDKSPLSWPGCFPCAHAVSLCSVCSSPAVP